MTVKISMEKVGNRIHLKPLSYLGGDMFQTYLAATKRVPGVSYNKTARCQTAPLDIEVCRALREVFGASLVLGEELVEWARSEVERERELAETASLSPTALHPLPLVAARAPEMYAAMCRRGFQTIAARFGAQAGSHLNADQPGLGKTLETFACLIERGVAGHVLVIAPKTSLEATWEPEVLKWLGEVGATAHVIPRDGDNPAKRREAIALALADSAPLVFLLVNAEMVRARKASDCDQEAFECQRKHAHIHTNYPELFAVEWSAIVGDEVHKYLMKANPRSKNVSQVGLGFQKLRSTDGFRIALSGTPMKGKPRLLWPTFHWLRPDLYPSQWRWSKHYFKTEDDAYAYEGQKVTDDLREDRREAFEREVGRMMIRRTKAELRAVNPEWAPPDKRYLEVWLPLSPKQRKAYAAIEKDAAVALAGGTLSANGILAEMTRLRQFAGAAGRMEAGRFVPTMPSNKVEWLLETFLPKFGITGDPATEQGTSKVVVTSQFTTLVNLAADALRHKGIEVHVLTGETPGHARTLMQQDFQTDGGPRVMLLNTNAGGVSITLDYADDLVILDETWVPDDQEQVEDRVHRTSRTDHQVTIWYVRSEGTIERDIAGSNVMKDDRQKRVLDGRRGIEVARSKFGAEEE